MTDFQKKIRSDLHILLSGYEEVLSCWEGGSAATGYWDEYSDLDLQIIVSDEFVEKAFSIIEDFLNQNYGLIHKFRIPEPSWHGHSQSFLLIDNCPETFYVDLLVEKESAENRFLEPDRHGNAVVWFDKKNLIQAQETPFQTTYHNCLRYYERINIYIPFCFRDVQKQIYRKNYIDAYAIYYSLLQRIVALMNIKYRPARFDFGMRYLHREFPPAKQELIQRLAYNNSLDDIQVNLNIIKDIYPALNIDIQNWLQENNPEKV